MKTMVVKFPAEVVEALARLDHELAGELYQAIMAYALNGVEPQGLSKAAEAIFALVRHFIARGGEKAVRRPRKKTTESSVKAPAAEPQQIADTISRQPGHTSATQVRPAPDIGAQPPVAVAAPREKVASRTKRSPRKSLARLVKYPPGYSKRLI